MVGEKLVNIGTVPQSQIWKPVKVFRAKCAYVHFLFCKKCDLSVCTQDIPKGLQHRSRSRDVTVRV